MSYDIENRLGERERRKDGDATLRSAWASLRDGWQWQYHNEVPARRRRAGWPNMTARQRATETLRITARMSMTRSFGTTAPWNLDTTMAAHRIIKGSVIAITDDSTGMIATQQLRRIWHPHREQQRAVPVHRTGLGARDRHVLLQGAHLLADAGHGLCRPIPSGMTIRSIYTLMSQAIRLTKNDPTGREGATSVLNLTPEDSNMALLKAKKISGGRQRECKKGSRHYRLGRW